MKQYDILKKLLTLISTEEGVQFFDPVSSFNTDLANRTNTLRIYSTRLNVKLQDPSGKEASIRRFVKLVSRMSNSEEEEVRISDFMDTQHHFIVFTNSDATQLFGVLMNSKLATRRSRRKNDQR